MSKGKDKAADTKQSAKQQEAQSTQTKGAFAIQRIFTKNISFDAPQLTTLFAKDLKPQLEVNIQTLNQQLENENYEVILTATVNGKVDNEIVFTIAATQAGIFKLQNFTQEQVTLILGTECLKMLFPYVRETITDLTTRATLPPLYLTPINFDAVYAQQLKKRAESETQV